MKKDLNVLAESKWPIRKGRKVYFFQTSGLVRGPWLELLTGLVHHYCPARESTMTVTKGQPFYNINTGTSTMVSAERVFPQTRAGRKLAELALAEAMQKEATHNRMIAADRLVDAVTWEEKAGLLFARYGRPRCRKRNRKSQR